MSRLPRRNPKGTAWGLRITPRPPWLREAFDAAKDAHPEIRTADDGSFWTTGTLWFVTCYWGIEGKTFPLPEPTDDQNTGDQRP